MAARSSKHVAWALALAVGVILVNGCGKASSPQDPSPTATAGASGQSPTDTAAGTSGGPRQAAGGSRAAGGQGASTAGGAGTTAGGQASSVAGAGASDGGSAASQGGGAGNSNGDIVANRQPPLPSSNARLEAWQLETEGAPALVLGNRYWDTKQQVFCQFVHAENGELRCYPDVPNGYAYSDTYADSACKKDVAWIYPVNGHEPPPRPWARPVQPVTEAVPCAPTLYQPLIPIPDSSPLFNADGGKGCQPIGTSDVDQLKMIVDAPDNWELGTEKNGPQLTARIHAVQLIMADGGGYVTRLEDERWNVGCTLERSTTGVECRSPAASISNQFADETCTAVLGTSGKCAEAGFVSSGSVAYELGAPFTGTFYGPVGPNQRCTSSGATSSSLYNGIRFFRRGAALDAAETMPQALRQGTLGTARLRLRGLVDQTGALVALNAPTFADGSYPYFDSVANEDCRPVWTSDGIVHCIPSSVAILPATVYFIDPACTQIALVCGTNAACASQKVVLTQRDGYGRSVVTGAYTTSAVADKADVYNLYSTGQCSTTTRTMNRVVTPMGALSLASYATLHERHPDAVAAP